MKVLKDGPLMTRIRTWLVEKAWLRIVLDKAKLDDTMLFALTNVVFVEYNKRSHGAWRIEYVGSKTQIEKED